MRLAPLLLLLVATPAFADDPAAAPAASDRVTIATVHGDLAVAYPASADQAAGEPPYGVTDLRLVVTFERGLLPYREPRGYQVRGVLVPELLAGALFTDGDRRMYVGGGVRFQADFSQRHMGLLEVSARGDVYMAGRAGLLADGDHTPFAEVALGEAFWIGGARVGFEFTAREIYAKQYDLEQPLPGALARVPWEGGNGHFNTLGAALTLGTPF